MHDGLMVSVSGVRGRVGDALTPECVATFAAGFGAWAHRQPGASRTRGGGARLPRVGADVPPRGARGAAVGGLRRDRCRDSRRRPPSSWRSSTITRPAGLRSPRATTRSSGTRSSSSARAGSFWTADEGRANAPGGRGRASRAPTWDSLGSVAQDDRGGRAAHRRWCSALPCIDVPAIRAAPIPRRARLRARRRRRDHSGAARAARLRRSPRSTWRPMAAFRARRSRSPRTSASWRRSCGRERLRMWDSRPIPTSTGWPSCRTLARAIGEDWTLALAGALGAAEPPGPVGRKPVDEPDRR